MLVTINGVDKTGKTTAINGLLSGNESKITVLPRITFFDPRWGKNDLQEDWYFRTDNVPEFMDMMSVSLGRLSEHVYNIKPTNHVYIQDRGIMAIMSSFKGFVRLKTGIGINEVDDYINRYCDNHKITIIYPNEDVSILLSPTNDIDKAVNFTLSKMIAREPTLKEPFIATYGQYQKYFNEELKKFTEKFTHIVDCNQTIPEVRESILCAINTICGRQIVK